MVDDDDVCCPLLVEKVEPDGHHGLVHIFRSELVWLILLGQAVELTGLKAGTYLLDITLLPWPYVFSSN